MGHTKGKFKIDKYGSIKNENGSTLLAFGVAIPMSVESSGECADNSKLICEAFNVTNETGLTPSELLSQRDELAEVLSDFIQINDSIVIPSSLSVGYFSKVTKAHNLLTKINTKP